jgi:hypothetical protein
MLGRDEFAGRLLHSSEYKNPTPFRDQDVLVVGPGSSGMEIAYDLAQGGAARVWLSARTPPNIFLREGPGGLPGDYIAVLFVHLPVRIADGLARFARRKTLGDLTDHGLPIPDEGVFARYHRLGVTPAVIDPEVIDAIKTGAIEIVAGSESLDRTGANLAGGRRVEAHSIICATGYTRRTARRPPRRARRARHPARARQEPSSRRPQIHRLHPPPRPARLHRQGSQTSRRSYRQRAVTGDACTRLATWSIVGSGLLLPSALRDGRSR